MHEEHPIQELVEDLDFNKAKQFVPENCTWVQRGIYIVCTSCELQHAVYIGTDKMLVGMRDGKPLLQEKSVYPIHQPSGG